MVTSTSLCAYPGVATYSALTRGAGASLLLHACGGPSSQPASAPVTADPSSIHSLKHIVIACQENRRLDTYFGSYPHWLIRF